MALRDFNRTVMLPMRVWDAPTRLFHWAIVLLVAFSYASSQLRWMQWHLWSGYALLTLLLFRLAWGFVGSETARFGSFLVNPLRGLRHLKSFSQRTPDTQVGHNEAGGWMVLVLLGVLAAQVVTGLFTPERPRLAQMPSGPFAHALSASNAALARFIHNDITWNLLLLAVGLHILAVIAYAVVKGHNLLRPMLTGVKRLPAATRQPRMASPLRALAVLAVAAALVWLLLAFA